MIETTNTVETREPILIPAPEVAKRLNLSERKIWSMHSAGQLPRPHRFGRAVRWSLDELRAWVAAGSPSRDLWETTALRN